MKTANKILISLIIVLSFSSCGKYEDGPAISFRSPEKRLIGLWEFTSINVDGVELINDYYHDSTHFYISISGTKEELFAVLVENNRGSSQLATSFIELNKKATEFGLCLSPNILYADLTQNFYDLIPALAYDNIWTIQRLSVNELWISASFQDSLYILKLNKTEQYIFNQ